MTARNPIDNECVKCGGRVRPHIEATYITEEGVWHSDCYKEEHP